MLPPALPTTEEDVKLLRQHLEGFAAACISQPMELNTDLKLVPYSELVAPFPTSDSHAVEARGHKSVDGWTPRVPAAGEGWIELRLTRRIRTGRYRGFSQVYGGRFRPERPGDQEVIIKIFQFSCSRGFHDARQFCEDDPKEWASHLSAHQHEAWAYFKLKDLQGSVIPHIHGFFKVRLPHGEEAIALVMERIHRTTTLPLSKSYQTSPDALEEVIKQLVSAVRKLVACDVVPADLAKRHIFWPELEGGKLGVPMIIDFGHIYKPTPDCKQILLVSTLQVLLQYRFDRNIVREYITTHLEPQSDICQGFDLTEYHTGEIQNIFEADGGHFSSDSDEEVADEPEADVEDQA
ncbi:hypothetical protein AURDEDRAFT_166135 [Auricularia subglabra TFB-10046 SS5]|nr:hypothetical protein AURDEDRAFT_166135 [Auricularia subglabra TFB-10046 SS5]